jgi:hypothetical protein
VSEAFSKSLVALQAVVLLAPITLLALAETILNAFRALTLPVGPIVAAQALIYAPALLSLACGWVLVIRFLRGGASALRDSSAWLWLGSYLGSAIAVAACVTSIVYFACGHCIPDTMPMFLLIFLAYQVIGIPAALLLLHLLLERRFRLSSNNRWRGP